MKYEAKYDISYSKDFFKELLNLKGVDSPEDYINPSSDLELDYSNLDHIEEGINLLLKHLQKDSSILFVVDCDADGVTSSAILWRYIKKIYPESKLYFSVHEEKKHGLSDQMERLLSGDKQYDLIICPDSSSNDYEEHRILKEMGVDILVLDHHNCEKYSENAVVINNQLSEKYSNKYLCGAGVVYKFCEALDNRLNLNYHDADIDLVSLGEISDMMDQRNLETRYLILKGLKNIRNEGLISLIEAQHYPLKEKSLPPYEDITPIDVAFFITPLINAVVRMGSILEKERMFLAFIEPQLIVPSTKRGAKNGEEEIVSEQFARTAINARKRQDTALKKAIPLLEFKIQKDDLLSNNILIIEINEEDKIPQSLTGLVCQQFVTKYSRPCLIVRKDSEGYLKGSQRSSQNFPIISDFRKFLEDSGYFQYAEGHDCASGVSISEKNLEGFLNYSNKVIDKEIFQTSFYHPDFIFKSNDFMLGETIFEIEKYPNCFGNQVDQVTYVVEDIPIDSKQLFINSKVCKLGYNGTEFIKFSDEDFGELLQQNVGNTITVYGRGSVNEFAGKTTPQIFITDYEIKENEEEDKFSF